ncbi:MAG TPA: fused MFS/spermidine synthase [Stellaceae bacterium]|nr:fused MFS/spermidine synthase [Stellaceae bacterium]
MRHRIVHGSAKGKRNSARPKSRNAGRRFELALLLAIAAAAFGGAGADAQGSRTLLESKESLYNNIYVYKDGNFISMTFGYNRTIYTESVYNTRDDRDLPVAYTQFMTESLVYAREIKSVLEIGFGGGRTSWYLHRFLPNVPVTSVELDPAVLELAQKYFGIREEPNFHVVNKDGRVFLAESKEKYDVILIDAYRGPFVPFHLLTKEFYQLVRDHLAEGGVVAQNVEPSTMLFDSAVNTIHSVFPNVDFYLAEGNVVTIAYDGPARRTEELSAVAGKRQAELQMRYDLQVMLSYRKPFVPGSSPVDPNAKVLTDDFAPVETLKAIEQHNRKWTGQ